jgi:hypothetical protein
MKLTIEIEGKEPEVIETTQYFILTDNGCSYSGAYEWLIGQVYFKLQEIKKKYADTK